MAESIILYEDNPKIVDLPQVGSSIGDPYVFPLNSNIPVKFPDKTAIYRLYEQGNNYINALIDVASKNHIDRMQNYASKYMDNIDDIIVDGYFYKQFYINAENHEIIINLENQKLLINKKDTNFFKISRKLVNYKFDELNNNVISYEISWNTQMYGSITVDILFFPNPHIENGITISPTNTNNAIGMLVHNYIPKLMELPNLNLCEYPILHDNLITNEILYENKNIKPDSEIWIT